MLLYFDGVFLQIIEGDDDAVADLLAVIRHDRRHKDLRILMEEPVTAPHFPDWSMAFLDIGALPPEERWLVRDLALPLPTAQSDHLSHRIHRLIRSFQDMVRDNQSENPDCAR